MRRRSDDRDDGLAAIEAVYRERFAGYVRLALAVTGEEQAALDAVHEAFVRAVRYRGGLRNRESVAGWISRIVLNEARRSRSPVPVRALEEIPEVVANGRGEGEAVRAARCVCTTDRASRWVFLSSWAEGDRASRGRRSCCWHRSVSIAHLPANRR